MFEDYIFACITNDFTSCNIYAPQNSTDDYGLNNDTTTLTASAVKIDIQEQTKRIVTEESGVVFVKYKVGYTNSSVTILRGYIVENLTDGIKYEVDEVIDYKDYKKLILKAVNV
jgi:hypothetical protein